MSAFDDARTLVQHSAGKMEAIRALHEECLAEKVVSPTFLVEVKNLMENLRSILDYCAKELFVTHGQSSNANHKTYFPYATPPADRIKFREEIVQRCIPGLLQKRPDIVGMLESYQYFGNTGNWLYLFMRLTNENKHEHLTPQIEKQYKVVQISGTIPAGGTLEIDLTKIPLGGGLDVPFHAVAGRWTGLVFEGTDIMVIPHLQHALLNVSRIVDEVSAA